MPDRIIGSPNEHLFLFREKESTMRCLHALMFSAIAAVVLLPLVANAEEDYPKSLVGFVKSDMVVGIRYIPAGVKVVIFADEGFEIAKDARIMNLEALAEKYPSVAEQKRQKLEEFHAEHKHEKTQPPDAVQIRMPPERSLFYKVIHVGNDYILVARYHNPTSRQVISSRTITGISWQTGVRLHVTTRRSR